MELHGVIEPDTFAEVPQLVSARSEIAIIARRFIGNRHRFSREHVL
jgi:hypothetical protein